MNLSRIRTTLTIGLLIALVSILTLRFWGYTQDDVFITYAYSRNIVAGYGFVFNSGEHIQGTTTPLYTLLMALLYLISPNHLLQTGNLFSAIFLIVACLILMLSLSKTVSRIGWMAAVFTFAASPLVYVSFGMETLFYCVILASAWAVWRHNHRIMAMLLAAALTWTRADGIVLGGTLWAIAAWDAMQSEQQISLTQKFARLPWKLGVIYAAGILPWFVFAWLYFGTPLPNTFSAKQDMLQGIRFLQDGLNWWKTFYGSNPLSWLGFPLIAVGTWQSLSQKTLRPIGLWALLYLAGYSILNVSAFWYFTPLFMAFCVLAAVGGEWLALRLLRTFAQPVVVRSTALAVISISTLLAAISAWPYGPPPSRVNTYKLVGEWINQNTSKDSLLLVGDLGIMGYYAQRRTIDSPGLITPEMHYKLDRYAAAKFKPDYVVATQYYTWQALMKQEWFDKIFISRVQISTSGDTFSPITGYQRRYPVDTPEQVVTGTRFALNCPLEVQNGNPIPDTSTAVLITKEGRTVSSIEQPFLYSQYPSTTARGDEHLQEQVVLSAPSEPGRYRWMLECGQHLEGDLSIIPLSGLSSYQSTSDATWADIVQLKGFALPDDTPVWAGGTLSVILEWETLSAGHMDYSVFIHVLDQKGNLVAQTDGYPAYGSSLSSTWRDGQLIIDPREIRLPANLPAGDYQIAVGWYDWQTGERIRLSNGEDAYILPIRVETHAPEGSGLP
jgi:hypothetical protein